MILFVNSQNFKTIKTSYFQNSLFSLETISTNYVFYFYKHKITIVFPKNLNFLTNIKNSFYLHFPKKLFEDLPQNYCFKLKLIEIVERRFFTFRDEVVLTIPSITPYVFVDFLNIIYEHSITNFWNDYVLFMGGKKFLE